MTSSTEPGSRLGSANSAASAVTAMIAMTCQRGRLSMIVASCASSPTLFPAEQAAQQALSFGCGRLWQHRLGVVVGLLAAAHRFAAGDDVGDGLLQHTYAQALCALHLHL